MKFVFDIDDTICTSESKDGAHKDYKDAKPIVSRIQVINKLWNEGHSITFFTARGMGRYDGDVHQVYANFYEFTFDQLTSWGVHFDRLIMGKPSADVYVDDKGISDKEYFNEKS
jgi:hypothetical protein